eukprot:UN27490
MGDGPVTYAGAGKKNRDAIERSKQRREAELQNRREMEKLEERWTGKKKDEEESNLLNICNYCRKSTCSKCKNRSHWPLTCDEVEFAEVKLEKYTSLKPASQKMFCTSDTIALVYKQISNNLKRCLFQWFKQSNEKELPDNELKFNNNSVKAFLKLYGQFDFAEKWLFELVQLCRLSENLSTMKGINVAMAKKNFKSADNLQKVAVLPRVTKHCIDKYKTDEVDTSKIERIIKNHRSLDKFNAADHVIKVAHKPCPKCEHPWEKNGGCKHMHCYNCGHHYCWDCLLPFIIGDGPGTHQSYFECPQKKVGLQTKGMVVEADDAQIMSDKGCI